MERTLKYLFLIFVISCATAPSPDKLTYKEIRNKECLGPIKNLNLTWSEKIQQAFQQTTGTAGSVLVTSAGVVSDTVVVTGGIATVFLCGYGNESGVLCDELLDPYIGLMEEADLLWTTKKAYKGTEAWRCPYVDHISRAYRKVSRCLHENGEYLAAFEQMGRVTNHQLIHQCVSQSEKLKWEELESELAKPVL